MYTLEIDDDIEVDVEFDGTFKEARVYVRAFDQWKPCSEEILSSDYWMTVVNEKWFEAKEADLGSRHERDDSDLDCDVFEFRQVGE